MIVNIALVQDTPVFFDKEKTLVKVEERVEECKKLGSKIVLFPESFIPGYPRGFNFGAVIGSRTDSGRELYKDYYDNSIDLESKDKDRLEKIAKENDIFLIIGVTEKDSKSGSLYCSLLYISPEKGVVGVHRKIKPTGTERLIWAESDGTSLLTFETAYGKIGGLICWENYMPFARMAMYERGVELYMAPTADSRPEWTSTMQHIALEGRCFVLGCNQYFHKSDMPEKYKSLVVDEPDEMCAGGSIIVSPLGKIIAGPLYGKRAIIQAEIELSEIIKSKMDFDPIGHYSRKDIFNFEVPNQPEIIDLND